MATERGFDDPTSLQQIGAVASSPRRHAPEIYRECDAHIASKERNGCHYLYYESLSTVYPLNGGFSMPPTRTLTQSTTQGRMDPWPFGGRPANAL